MRLRHIGIVTQNIEKEKEFYLSATKGKIVDDHIEHVRIVKIQGVGGTIELLQYESQSDHSLRKAGLSHIAFTQDPDGNNIELVKETKNAMDE